MFLRLIAYLYMIPVQFGWLILYKTTQFIVNPNLPKIYLSLSGLIQYEHTEQWWWWVKVKTIKQIKKIKYCYPELAKKHMVECWTNYIPVLLRVSLATTSMERCKAWGFSSVEMRKAWGTLSERRKAWETRERQIWGTRVKRDKKTIERNLFIHFLLFQ